MEGVVRNFKIALAALKQNAKRVEAVVELHASELESENLDVASGATVMPQVAAVAGAVDGHVASNIRLPCDTGSGGHDASAGGQIVSAG